VAGSALDRKRKLYIGSHPQAGYRDGSAIQRDHKNLETDVVHEDAGEVGEADDSDWLYVLTSFSELWKQTYPKYIAPTRN
jgi:hypothetical protein